MKGTKFSDVVKEYGRKLSDGDLRYLLQCFYRRIGGDFADAVELIQRNPEMDGWLGLAKSASDFFDMVDDVDLYLQAEARRRFNSYDQKDRRAG